MADRTARDAAIDAVLDSRPGCVAFYPNEIIDAVLAALGIPADTDPRRIEAGLAVMEYVDASAPGRLDAALSSPNGWTGRQIVNLVWATRCAEPAAAARLEEPHA